MAVATSCALHINMFEQIKYQNKFLTQGAKYYLTDILYPAMSVLIQRIPIDLYNHPTKTGNFPKDPNDLTVQDLDYDTETAKTNLLNYADLIDYPIDHTYQFTKEEIDIILSSMEICIKVNKLSHLVEEELKPVIKRMNDNWKDGSWFVRFNSCSPKDGKGKYPIQKARAMIEMIISSTRARGAFQSGEDTLYFVKYDYDWDASRELRVFIYNQHITAISQYNPYDTSFYSDKDDRYLYDLAIRIKEYLKNIIPVICSRVHTNDIICDIYLDTDVKLHIIEFNSFGYWLPGSSVLFEWLRDKDLLYNQSDSIYFRLLVDENK
jgi:hypothetical protein